MDKTTKIQIGAGAAALALSYAAGWFSHQPETVTKTQTVTVEKQVDKIVYQDRVVADHSVTTTVDKKPTGEVVTTTTKADVDTEAKTASQTDETTKSTQTTTSTTSAPQGPDYGLGLSARFTLSDPLKPTYQIDAGRRLLGPVWLTGTVGMDASAAIGLRIEF